MINRTGFISRRYRHLKRYQEIISIIIRHGFGDFVTQTGIAKLVFLGRKTFTLKPSEEIQRLSRYERIKTMLEELGPTFVKFGQIMSNRPDILSFELIEELEKLQSNVKPISCDTAIEVIENETKKKVEDSFIDFEKECIASASIAQVHKAKLHTGEDIVVKIQRPGIQKVIETDLEIMYHLASIIEKRFPETSSLNPVGIVEEFSDTIKKEIDFFYEAAYIERFAQNFKHDKTIHVPGIYRDFCSKKIITMEYVDGIKVTHIEKLKNAGNDPKVITDRATRLILKQIFKFGFFHADPHPGNIFILRDNVICFLDFGMMGVLPPDYREHLSDFVIGFVNRDIKKISKAIFDFSHTHPYSIDIYKFERKLGELIEQFTYLPLKEIDMAKVIRKSIDLVVSFKIKLPSSIYLLSKALITIEGVARKLEPDFDIVKHIKPYAKRLIQERYNPFRIMKDTYLSINEASRLVRDMPFEIREIIEQVKRGKMKIEFEHKGLEPFMDRNDRISNRLAFAIIIGCIVIGSSIVVLTKVPPMWKGMSIIGIAGFVTACVMGFWLLISIIRSGRL